MAQCLNSSPDCSSIQPHPYGGPIEPKDLTHPVSTMPVGHQHADEDEEHEDTLDGQHAGPEKPGLLHPAGGAVLTALTARPARETDGHVRVAHTAAVTPVHRAAFRIYTYINPCEDLIYVLQYSTYSSILSLNVSKCHTVMGRFLLPPPQRTRVWFPAWSRIPVNTISCICRWETDLLVDWGICRVEGEPWGDSGPSRIGHSKWE